MSAEAPLSTHARISRRKFFEVFAVTAVVSALPTPVLAQGPPPVPGNCVDGNTEMASGGCTIYSDREVCCEQGRWVVTRRLSNSDAAPAIKTPAQTIGLMGRDQGSDEQPDYPSTQENGSGDSVFICGVAAILIVAAIGGSLAGAAGGLSKASGHKR